MRHDSVLVAAQIVARRVVRIDMFAIGQLCIDVRIYRIGDVCKCVTRTGDEERDILRVDLHISLTTRDRVVVEEVCTREVRAEVVRVDIIRLGVAIQISSAIVAIVEKEPSRKVAIDKPLDLRSRLLDRAVLRLDVFRLDRKLGRRDACRILERFARCTICELVILVLQALQTYRRIVDVVADILRDATICRTRKCTRVRNVKKQRAIAIDTRKGGLAEWVFLAILRRVERRTIRIDDLFLGNRVRRDVDIVRTIIVDVVVPQDVALTVERCLVVVLADVVRLRQIIVVGRTVVAIVDDNVVLVAIDELRVGRHRAIVCLDRAIDRLDALARDREVGLLDRRALVEREGTRVLKTVILLVLCAEAVERDNRVIGILG